MLRHNILYEQVAVIPTYSVQSWYDFILKEKDEDGIRLDVYCFIINKLLKIYYTQKNNVPTGNLKEKNNSAR